MNDRERREYIGNPRNWRPLGETNGVRVTEMTYKTRSWYRIEIWQNHITGYDHEKGGPQWGRDWIPVQIYEMDEKVHAYKFSVTTSDVAKAMKKIDKEEKNK